MLSGFLLSNYGSLILIPKLIVPKTRTIIIDAFSPWANSCGGRAQEAEVSNSGPWWHASWRKSSFLFFSFLLLDSLEQWGHFLSFLYFPAPVHQGIWGSRAKSLIRGQWHADMWQIGRQASARDKPLILSQ
jgi:hypothetical protein